MADRIVAAGKAYPTPNWKKWRLIPEPRLWQCVALSLDIDPDSIEIDPVFGRDPIFPRRFRELRDRIDIAREGLRGPLHSTQIDIYNPLRSRVSLHQFAVWAHRIGWELPPELLAVADQHCQDIDWDYWTALDLWPLVDACKLVYGVNPNEPTRLEDIENPETKTRPAWVNLFHKAQAAIMAEKLKVQAG
ncbi:MAG: hypothetical protein LC776_07325, partial [Acidobacteria bacterium]|nr:hypothetical protein [Acidobacteriota bacterium]